MKHIKHILTIILLTLITSVGCANCGSTEAPPNIRTEPCIDYCSGACDKMQKLYDNGDESCLPYIEIIVVDGQDMDCFQFCDYECKRSINLPSQCIVEQITTCEEIPTLCEEK